jgi:lysozyme
MRTSDIGIALIIQFEGLRLRSYYCPANVLTIGYGHTGDDVYENQVITEIEAYDLLYADLKYFEDEVNDLLLDIEQCQFDALVSFSYNVGIGSLKRSTLLKKVRINPNDLTIRNEFMRWNKIKVNGHYEVSNGLMNRRIAEANLYFT